MTHDIRHFFFLSVCFCLFWYWCNYQHMSKHSVSPPCGSFTKWWSFMKKNYSNSIIVVWDWRFNCIAELWLKKMCCLFVILLFLLLFTKVTSFIYLLLYIIYFYFDFFYHLTGWHDQSISFLTVDKAWQISTQ